MRHYNGLSIDRPLLASSTTFCLSLSCQGRTRELILAPRSLLLLLLVSLAAPAAMMNIQSVFLLSLLSCLVALCTATITPPTSNPASSTPFVSGLLPNIGVCLSGMEYGRVPGTPGRDYAWPTADEYQYFHSKQFTLVRLPFKWERLYPQLMGALDKFSVAVLHNQLAIAATLNMSILLDCHNYARWNGTVLNGTTGVVTSDVFADFWLKMASEFRGTPGLHGYDLMNEPSNMPDLHVWPQAAQAAINAIRRVDKDTTIYLEGNNCTTSHSHSTLSSCRLTSNRAFVLSAYSSPVRGCLLVRVRRMDVARDESRLPTHRPEQQHRVQLPLLPRQRQQRHTLQLGRGSRPRSNYPHGRGAAGAIRQLDSPAQSEGSLGRDGYRQ